MLVCLRWIFGDRAGGVHVPEHRRAAAAQLRRRRRHVCPGSLRRPPEAFCTCTRSHAHTLGQERAKQALDDILDRLPDQFDLHEVRMGWRQKSGMGCTVGGQIMVMRNDSDLNRGLELMADR